MNTPNHFGYESNRQHRRQAKMWLCIALLLTSTSGAFSLYDKRPIDKPEDRVVLDYTGPQDSNGVPKPWFFKKHPFVGGEWTVSTANGPDGESSLCVTSKKSSFSINRQINIDTKKMDIMTWKWQANELPVGGHVDKKDDQALQVIVLFSDKIPTNESDLDGKAIAYVWDTTAEEEHITTSGALWYKYKVIVVQSGEDELGEWVTETRDLAKDWETTYGGPMPPIRGVRLQSNSQHTKSSGAGCFGEVMFSGD